MTEPAEYRLGLAYYDISPDVGPDCICSWCWQPIEDFAFRLWLTGNVMDDILTGDSVDTIRVTTPEPRLEARLHKKCLQEFTVTPAMPAGGYDGAGFPIYFWQNEKGGVLKEAVEAYILHFGADGPALSRSQLEIVRRFLEYGIFAPAWKGDEALETLRDEIAAAVTAERIREWNHKALKIGIDLL